MYAVVSEAFVDSASSLVLKLSAPAPSPANERQHAKSRFESDVTTGTKDNCGLSLIELSVEQPVDLVVGSRRVMFLLRNAWKCCVVQSSTCDSFMVGDFNMVQK